MTATATSQKSKGSRTRPAVSAVARLRQRRWIQIGCVPAAIIGALVILSAINLIVLQDVSYAYITSLDPTDYVLRRALTVSMVALGAIQLAAAWIMGLIGAVAGASATVGRGYLLRRRLAVHWRRFAIMAVAVLTLRLLMGAVGILGLALIAARVIALNATDEAVFALNNMLRSYVLVLAGFTSVAALSALVGPFLRLRYSIALGALAATWAGEPAWRHWLGLRARLGAGLIGIVTLAWAAACGVLMQTIGNELSTRPLARIPSDMTSVVGVVLSALTAALAIYLAGQVALPEAFLWLARRRLQRRPERKERRLAPL